MNKDIIYIDTEDDITAIIGKIKKANEKIVALVPPKRTGVLQSAVNLRLLARMAKKEGKELVLISGNKALIALSAAAKIPVAKNLQSKPEIAQIAALEVDDGEDIIDGSNLAVGDMEKLANKKPGDDIAKDLNSIDIDDEATDYVVPSAIGSDDKKPTKIARPKNNVKVPNFGSFRKKLFLGIGAGVLLIIFLIWAIWFAPSAKVIITAKTQAAPVSMTLNLSGTAPTNVDTNTVQTVRKQIKKDVTVSFTATGSKMVGTSASGNVIFKNCETLTSQTIASGTVITSNGLNYTTQTSVTVPAGTGSLLLGCTAPGVSTPVAITASDVGSDYNTANGTTFSVSNHANTSSVYLRGVATTDIAGGASHQAVVVTAADVQKAKQALVDQTNADVKKQLTAQFTNGETVITDSFKADHADATSVPAIDAEATGGNAKLTSATTFSMTAIAKSELTAFLRDAITKQMDASKKQRIYDDGYSKVTLSGYQTSDTGSTVNIATIGQFGPDINKEDIKNQVKGKNFGDAQSLLSSINNVSNVDIKFPYFWVTTIPNDTNKITVEFQISNA